MKHHLTIGDKHGRLTILKMLYGRGNKTICKCRCDCGNLVDVRRYSIVDGNTTSCGCYAKEQNALTAKEKAMTHGRCYTPVYKTWCAMNRRCYSKKHPAYKNYGGRGIKIEWISFEDFYLDMGDRPEGKEIDRINTNGNYCKENCRWVTPSENAKNSRSSKRWVIEGVVYESSHSAANALNVSRGTIKTLCNGRHRNGRFIQPLAGCYSEKKYDIDLGPSTGTTGGTV